MNANERRAVKAWDEWAERPTKPQRPKLPAEYRADYRVYGARGWVGMDGKRHDCRDSWEESIRFKGKFTL